MSNFNFPTNDHVYYHAHVYFDHNTVSLATTLCHQVSVLFNVKLGRMHHKTIGPHPRWSCQISFSSNVYHSLIPWLEENRKGLTILIHALTGDDLKDHEQYSFWLGETLALNLSVFIDN